MLVLSVGVIAAALSSRQPEEMFPAEPFNIGGNRKVICVQNIAIVRPGREIQAEE